MPATMVRKMTGVTIIFTRLMNVSPIGFIWRAVSGENSPRATPALIATRTWTVEIAVEAHAS